MTCPDYPKAIKGLPNSSSEFAAEGTAAHAVSDDCLALGLDAADFIGSKLTVHDKDDDDKKDDDKKAGGIAQKLFDARQILICEAIDQKMASRVVSQLLALARNHRLRRTGNKTLVR